MKLWHSLTIFSVFILSCSHTPQAAFDHYLDHLKSGKAEPYKELTLNGQPLPFLAGPPIKARDDLFRMIVSKARIETLSFSKSEDRVIYKVKIHTLDTEKLMAQTLVHVAVMQRVAVAPVPPEHMAAIPFIEMYRLALLPEAPKKTLLSEIYVVKKDAKWVVEPPPAFIGALFGFEGPDAPPAVTQ
jgi:hypothetical protein